MKKYVIPLIAFSIITVLVLLTWELNKDGIVTAQQLMSDYMNDAYKADKIYTKGLILTGTIRSITQVEAENYINQFEYLIKLDGGKVGNSQTEVWCYFPRSEASKLQDMKEGDTLRISGSVNADSHYDPYDNKQKLGGLRRYTPPLPGPFDKYKRVKIQESDLIHYVAMDGCQRVR